MLVAVTDFDEVSEDFVVANLQGADAGSCAFIGLNPGDAVFPTVAQPTPIVQFAVDTIANGWLIANGRRRAR